MSDINYNFAPQNPMPGMMQALQFGQYLGGVRDQRAQAASQAQALQQAAQEKAARDAQAAEVMAAIEKNPSGENFMKLVNLSSPKDAEGVRATWAQMDKATQQSMLTESMKVFALLENNEKERAKKELEARRDGYSNAGNKDGAAKTQAWIDMIDAGKENVVKNIYGMMITTIPGGKDAIDALAKLGEERRAESIAGKLEKDIKEGTLDPEKAFGYEMQLNNTVNTRMAASRESNTLYQNIKAGADMKDGVGDMAIINMFMRQLSPGIVTGEDYAAATKSGGVLSELMSLKGKVAAGELMTDPQRVKFVTLSKQFMENAVKQNEEQLRSVRAMVKNYGLNPENVFGTMPSISTTPGITTTPSTGTSTPASTLSRVAAIRELAKKRIPQDAKRIDGMSDEAFMKEYKKTIEIYDASQSTGQSGSSATVEVDF